MRDFYSVTHILQHGNVKFDASLCVFFFKLSCSFRQVAKDMSLISNQASNGAETLQLACYGISKLLFIMKIIIKNILHSTACAY